MIRLLTKHPDGTAFDCIPLSESKSLVIVQEITSFEPDGIVAIPRNWILRIRNGKVEETGNAIIRHDHTITEPSRCFNEFADATTLPQLISRLHDADIWPAIEIISNRTGIVHVGPITNVSDTSFRMHPYSASSDWLEELEIDYGEVFKVEIESLYTAHFNSYMRSKPIQQSARNKKRGIK
jgi:hypothetical protein